jgi:hypothetical protein
MCTAVARPPEEREGVRHRESHVQTPDRVARAPIEVPSEARRRPILSPGPVPKTSA